jgi:hypothetical protein
MGAYPAKRSKKQNCVFPISEMDIRGPKDGWVCGIFHRDGQTGGVKGVGSCPPALPGERVPLAQGGASRRVVESLRPALGAFSPHPATPERGD